MSRVYLASSWRNEHQPEIVRVLRGIGHEVYDFRNPQPGDNGFSWREIDPGWETWSPLVFREALRHKLAESGFRKDMLALDMCDVCLLVLPCGRSAHLELGWAVAARKHTAVLLDEGCEPELMYKMVDRLIIDQAELLEHFEKLLIQSADAVADGSST